MDGFVQYARSWSLRKTRQPVKAYNSDCVCLPRLAVRLSTYARSTCPPSLPIMKIFPPPCNARFLFTTTHLHLTQRMSLFISPGFLVAIADYCMTWNPCFVNRTRPIPINCCTRVAMITPLHKCGWGLRAPQVGIRFPCRILIGYPV